jgi:hypothetical protein
MHNISYPRSHIQSPTFVFLASGSSACGLGPLFMPACRIDGAARTGAAPGGGVKGSTAGLAGVEVPLATVVAIPFSFCDNCPILAVGTGPVAGIGAFEDNADIVGGAVTAAV